MPEKPLTIAAYAAGASLAAVSILYVFGPTFFLDEETSSANRKKGVVGLSNPANDCFINSILQALAGLSDLRLYLIREIHRRKLDGHEVYDVDPDKRYEDPNKREVPAWKLEMLQKGLVTGALKEILDNLNERPIYRKTISAHYFVMALEKAFKTRISRQQQDAQEFLQVVTERLCEEYHAGKLARKNARQLCVPVASGEKKGRESISDEGFSQKLRKLSVTQEEEGDNSEDNPREIETKHGLDAEQAVPENGKEFEDDEEEEGFPFEGQMESQIECLTCHFKPKPSVSTFVTLTLSVPQKSSTTLNACFDGMLKIEHIDDYTCDKCRLEHAIKCRKTELAKARSEKLQNQLTNDLEKLTRAFEEDPEKPPADVPLPESKLAPKTRIARHIRISKFPKVLAIHLSRSIFSAASTSTKNMAKVNFPEALSLGGILDQKQYRLLGSVTHKGSHNSGHYESFRRQQSSVPYSTPNNFGTGGVYSKQNTPLPSTAPSPRVATPSLRPSTDSTDIPRPSLSTLSSPSIHHSPSTASTSTTTTNSSRSSLTPSSSARQAQAPTSAPRTSSLDVPSDKPKSLLSKTPSIADLKNIRPKTRRKQNNRWWRISDEKIKECRTSEVLGMQREIYLLFYELERGES